MADDGPFVELAASHNVCGIRAADGTVTCWGPIPEINEGVPEGAFVAVDVSLNFACAIDTEGEATCSGAFDEAHTPDYVPPPEGPFVSLGSGEHVQCGVRPDGSVACFGAGAVVDAVRPPLDLPPMTAIDLSHVYGCGVTTRKHMVCWGDTTLSGGHPPED